MGASFKTLARVQAKVERGLSELDPDDAKRVLKAIEDKLDTGEALTGSESESE